MRISSTAVAIALLGLHASHPHAQPPSSAPQPPAQRADRVDASDVTAIIVDVVVRDRRGNPVTDLTAADFELTEDGVRQEIGSFTPIAGGGTAGPAAAVAAAAGDAPAPATGAPAAGARASGASASGTSASGAAASGASASGAPTGQAPAIVALVFDRLAPEARALAHKAALQYIGDSAVANNIVAVFGVDLSLIFYQPFTRDATLIRQGIEAAGGRSSSRIVAERPSGVDQATPTSSQIGGGRNPGQPDPNAAPAGAAGAASAAVPLLQIQDRMKQRYDALERDMQGYSSANALMAIVSAMRAIPGRKSVVFFSEGLSIPSNVQARFSSVIDAANRANVSIYPMDASGLRTVSPGSETREGLYDASRAVADGLNSAESTNRPGLAALENNEYLLRADPHSGLGILAEDTGGMLIAGTNDMRAGFNRIDTDLRNYYVLTYVPKNTTLDGRFRRIDVKVGVRSGLRVHARKGYFAVRASAGTPVLGYEAPALAALEQTPVPNAFAVRAAAFRFPETTRPGLVSVLVNVPTAGITFRPVNGTKGEKLYSSDFIVLVRFRDQSGQVVEKTSQRYQIQGPIDQMARATQGDVLFYRQPELVPGVYAMETVVYDAFSSKATVRLATAEVPDVDPSKPRLSSLLLLRGSETLQAASERPGGHPLVVADQLLNPNLGEPLSKASTKELSFYFVAYPSADGGASSASVELLRNGAALATAPLSLGTPEKDGRLPQVGRLPLDTIPPGNYELRVVLRQGAHAATRSLAFRVVE